MVSKNSLPISIDREVSSNIYLPMLCALAPPEVAIYGADDTVNSGDDVSLTCNVNKGDVPVSISWTYHGRQLPLNRGFTTELVGKRTSILLITSASHGHSGTYTCLAKNAAGLASSSISLVVKGLWSGVCLFRCISVCMRMCVSVSVFTFTCCVHIGFSYTPFSISTQQCLPW